MITNFEIEENIGIRNGNTFFDLHNNYSFIKFDFREGEKEVILYWDKSDGKWAEQEVYNHLKINHTEITYFEYGFLDNENTSFEEDRKVLSTITFFPSNNRHDNNSYTTQVKPTMTDDIIYVFENGNFIRIKCKSILFELD